MKQLSKKQLSNSDKANSDKEGIGMGFLKKAAFGGLSAMLLVGTLGALPANADPAGAPNNTGTGQTAASNSTSSGGGSNSSDDDNQDERDRKERERKAREAAARRAHQNRENRPLPPAKPSPNPPSDNVVADKGADNDHYYYGSGGTIKDTVYGPIITFDGPGMDGVQSGNVGLQGKPANDPVNRSATSKCDFHSGTTNLDATHKMFKEKNCGSWDPYVHKCDYSDDGWHCYLQ